MKPLSSIQNFRPAENRPFPVTDYNYGSIRLGEFGRCARSPRPSFVNISRDYFAGEARFDFVIESVVFALVTVTAVPAFIDCARALIEFFRAVGIS